MHRRLSVLLTVGRLSQYWMDRERSVDAHRWLRRGMEVIGAGAVSGFAVAVVRAAFGGILATEQRMDDAMPHVLGALPELSRPEERCLPEAAETLLELAARV